MTRNLKTLGLALLAAFALSAVAASAASADDTFTAPGQETVDLTGHSVEPTLILAESEISCETGTYSGTSTEDADLIRAHPVYHGFKETSGEGCIALGQFPATVNTDGCDYILSGETVNGHATAEVDCTEGHEITISVWFDEPKHEEEVLTLHIGSQAISGIAYDKTISGGKSAVTATATVEGINATCTGPLCFLLGGTEFENVGYTDDVTVTGWEDTDDFMPDSTTHEWSGSHGSQIDITFDEGETIVPRFHSEISNTTLIAEDTGSEEMIFNAGSATCEEAGYKGAMSASTQTTVTIKPEFASCEAFGFASTEVSFSGCAYVLHRGESAKSSEGSVDIECPSGKTIEVVAKVRGLLKCRVTISAQTGLTTVTETNKGAGSSRDIALDIGLTGVAYSQETGEGLGKCEAGSFENGELSGSPTLIGENEAKEQVGIWAE